MADHYCDYLIIGAGLTGASAIEGIRELDPNRPITMIGAENHLSYNRPPLSKKLWFGKKKVEDIFVHDQAFYDRSGVTLVQGRTAASLDARRKEVRDDTDTTWRYGKLLLATGGEPRQLAIPGGNLEGVFSLRTLDDYLRIRKYAVEGSSALIIGGGFIGSEIAAALAVNKVNVTMVFPDPYLVRRVFPEHLGMAIQARYEERGVRIVAGDESVAIAPQRGRLVTTTRRGQTIQSDFVVAGIGVTPAVSLARQAGLTTPRPNAAVDGGITVNAFLQTSDPDIYAAGDNAWWYSPDLRQSLRLEHWDNARSQGKWAGRNMAGAGEVFTYLPYFFSDLFEFGYEAVGRISGKLETYADWKKENDTGVVYYLDNGKVAGVMMCNVWNKVSLARELIRKEVVAAPEKLRGAIG